MFGNLFAAHPQSVSSRRGPIYRAAYTYSPRICNPFRIHSRNVRNVFVFCMLHIRITKVWFLTCKKGVFELQKYGFCFLNVALLQFVRHAFVECSQHCCKLFATLLQFVCHAFAICSPHCCNPFATHSQFVRHVVAICLPRFRTS